MTTWFGLLCCHAFVRDRTIVMVNGTSGWTLVFPSALLVRKSIRVLKGFLSDE